MSDMRKIKLTELIPSGIIIDGSDVTIEGLNLCNRITKYKSILSYVVGLKYIEVVKNNSNIKAIILNEADYLEYKKVIEDNMTYVITEEPEKLFYNIHENLFHNFDFYDKNNFKPMIGQNTHFGQNIVIEDGVIIGSNVTIGHNTVIKKGSVIADNVQIGSNTTIGSEGFQVINFGSERKNIIHVGGVQIGYGTTISDNCTICNSLFEGSTIIGENVKIDNLVHIAHNSTIGNNVVITAGVILCGSTHILDQAWIGTNSTILNNVTIGKKTVIGIGSVVTRSIPDGQTAYGVPAKVHL